MITGEWTAGCFFNDLGGIFIGSVWVRVRYNPLTIASFVGMVDRLSSLKPLVMKVKVGGNEYYVKFIEKKS